MAGFARTASLLAAAAALTPAQVPDFVHGEECLFCHRNNIGRTWQANPHNRTTRPGQDGEFVLGARDPGRRLHQIGYGKFAILDGGAWNETKFADRCAGCHTTAVDPADRTFSYVGLDCYSCHGVVDLRHSGATGESPLLSKNRREAATVLDICGSCHFRGGQSTQSRLPYAESFVPGQPLAAVFSRGNPEPADSHIHTAAEAAYSCLHCHDVHGRSTRRHRRAAPSAVCDDCHLSGQPRRNVRPYPRGSITCETASTAGDSANKTPAAP